MQHKKVCKLVASDSRSFVRAYDDLQLNEVLNLRDDAHPIPYGMYYNFACSILVREQCELNKANTIALTAW